MAAQAVLEPLVLNLGLQTRSNKNDSDVIQRADLREDLVAKHLASLIEICRRPVDASMASYADAMCDELCAGYDFQCEVECPRQLANLLPLAANALERIAEERRVLAKKLAWSCDEMPESD